MWLDLAGWYLHLCMLKMDVPKHKIFPYLSLPVSHVMHWSPNIQTKEFRSPKNHLHRLGEKLKALLQLHTGSRCKVLLLQASTLQGINISPKNGILKMIFLFPRWDMLIPWRVSQSMTCLGCSYFHDVHLLPQFSNGQIRKHLRPSKISGPMTCLNGRIHSSVRCGYG